MTTQGRPFVHIEIPAKDRMASAKFYADLFGWGFQHMDAMNYSMFDSGNVGGGLPPVDDQISKPGNVMVYVDSADIEADLKKIELLGGKIVMPKTEIPGMGWYAVFSDLTGNQLALYTAPAQS